MVKSFQITSCQLDSDLIERQKVKHLFTQRKRNNKSHLVTDKTVIKINYRMILLFSLCICLNCDEIVIQMKTVKDISLKAKVPICLSHLVTAKNICKLQRQKIHDSV